MYIKTWRNVAIVEVIRVNGFIVIAIDIVVD